MKIFTTLLLLLPFISLSQINQEQKDKIDTIINSQISANDPGIMVGIVKEGEIIYENYQGLASLEYQVEVNVKTRSNIASTAKQFTALMILQMSMEGKLSLEDDVRKYLSKLYPKVKDDIKIRHLINHTSGIRDYVELMGLEGDVWWKRVGLDNGDVMALLERQVDLGFKPGSRFSYSNSGYVILAKIIEKVTDKKFTDYSDDFFESLGMNETSFIKRYMQVIPNRASPYADWGYGEIFHSISVTKTAGEGFLYTTLKDQLVYEQAIQNAFKNKIELLIKSQQPIPNSEIKTYGFGLKLDDRLGRNTVYHDGVTNAYNAQALRFPDDKLSVFIMSNNGNIRSDLMADEIASVLLPKLDVQKSYDPQYFESVASLTNTEILGQYYNKNGFLTRIVEEEGKTYFRQGKYLKLELINEDNSTYYFASDPQEKLRFYTGEMILFYASGEARKYQKIDTPMASIEDLEALVGSYNNSELDLSFTIDLKDKNEATLMFSNDDYKQEVLVFNREDLLAGDNYILKVLRDDFDRVVEIKLSYDRAKNISFKKTTNLQFQPKIQTDFGSINVTTISSRTGESSDILITANYPNGNEIWSQQFGGSSYDKASSIIASDDGYLIIGSTSSYGNGNYDIYVIKTDKKGNRIWQNTYGGFYNEYGYSGQRIEGGYLIKGTKQECENNSDINRKCTSNVWFVTIDKEGNQMSESILEEIHLN